MPAWRSAAARLEELLGMDEAVIPRVDGRPARRTGTTLTTPTWALKPVASSIVRASARFAGSVPS